MFQGKGKPSTWIAGPTGSGKSLELISYLERNSIAGRAVLAIKHAFDDQRSVPTFTLKRSDDGIWSPTHPLYPILNPMRSLIKSRRGLEYPCVQMNKLMPFLSNPVLLDWVEVFGFDEMQFFDDAREAVIFLMNKGKVVITSGLDSNYRGEPFNHYTDLVALATEVIKLKAVCLQCGSFDAVHSQRLIPDDREVVIGTTNYEARCSCCFDNPPTHL